ncbi:MAG: DUF1799 domain-containing protein [Gammaproteobacteria bacterium]|nr:DUF1799 domain-containing protein [Gammaproteobacteria bacterium]
MYFKVKRCWRYAPSGAVVGFDWAQVKALLELSSTPEQERILDGLMIMEGAILDSLHKTE